MTQENPKRWQEADITAAMVLSALGRLDGPDEMQETIAAGLDGAYAAGLSDSAALQAENARLREALGNIEKQADAPSYSTGSIVVWASALYSRVREIEDIARAALQPEPK